MSDIGERIKEALSYRGMSQRQLAEYLGMTEVSISRYITGNRTPKAPTLKKISDFCGVPTGFFYGSEESQMSKGELTKDEAFAVAEFIDMNLIQSVRDDTDIDSIQWLRNIIHAYEKLCLKSGYVGLTEHSEEDEG